MKVDPADFPAHPDHGTLVLSLVLLVGLGLAMAVSGLVRLRRARRLRDHGVHAMADVVPARTGGDTRGRVFQRVLYLVTEPGGRAVQLVTVGPHLARHRPGEPTAVVFEPGDPAHARADEPIGRLVPWLLLVGGTLLCAVTILIAVPDL